MKSETIEKRERYKQFFLHLPELCFIVSAKGTILEANKCALKTLGYTKRELLNKSVQTIYSAESLSAIKRLLVDRKRISGVMEGEVTLLTKNGEEHAVILNAGKIKGKGGESFYCIFSHKAISERNELEERLKASLQEKEILLKEIHHRVKNNMQIIYSLINFQSRYTKDKDALKMYKETQDRVRTMALIHEKFYQTKDLSKINFADYVRNLIASLFYSYGIRSSDVELDLNIQSVFLDINTAIPCGLIINELASNSFKHAFSERKKGKIIIDFNLYNENKYVLNFSDDGIGIPKNIDFHRTESLGLQLISTLVDQLEGSIALNRRRGTAFRIVFENKSKNAKLKRHRGRGFN